MTGSMSTAITFRSYAKINLYLDVLGKRRDGYHNIETLFQTVDLADELVFTDRPHGIDIECSTPELPANNTNLAYRAAALMQAYTGCRRGVHIYLDKRIPLAAGLAGGSGNAAATLAAVNQLWELKLAPRRLQMMARELGADVPYCLLGGPVAARLRGDDLYPMPPIDAMWVVLVHPPLAISTAGVYASPHLRPTAQRPFAGWTPRFRAALRALRRRDWAAAVYNRLEDAVFPNHPQLRACKEALLAHGAVAAAMSGSGPTLFGLCETKKDAEAVQSALSDCTTTVAPAVAAGIERIQ